MTFIRTGMILAAAAGLALSQNGPRDSAAFEVASIKPHPIPPGQFFFRMAKLPGPPIPQAVGNRFTLDVITLQELIMQAYGVMDYQILGMADWVKSPSGEHYDLAAKVEGEGTPTVDQLRAMLQNLLADRFQLKLHREKKELPVLALVVAKNPPKLRQLSEAERAAAEAPRPAGPRPTQNPSSMTATIDPMLIRLLANFVDRPIIDHTGLKGTYEFANLDWRQLGQEHREDPVGGQASLFAALQEQLGLKLEPRKDLVDVVVIDHADKPSAN